MSENSHNQHPKSPPSAGARLALARLVGVVGLVAYNWWVAVPFKHGLLTSPDGFFSDLEANGRPYSAVMQHLDLVAGILLVIALVARGAQGRARLRREWPWMIAFAGAGVVGGKYSYACAEGLSTSCRHLEWRFQLPLHHYIHIAAGVVEFATITIAVLLARRQTRDLSTPESRLFKGLVGLFVVGYPILGAAYLSDRLGAVIEPVFFVAFSLMVLVELFEPATALVRGPIGGPEASARRKNPSSAGDHQLAASSPTGRTVPAPPEQLT
ncbi:MAG: DUF998 domain-containing protein [Acidimicrobiales bacterium]